MKLRMGIVGGGPGSFIGRVHVTAATMDSRAALTAGVFSSDRMRSLTSGGDWGVDADRIYENALEMMRREAELPEDQRVDFVTIATPNDLHYPFASAAIEAGFHVYCDKPMTTDLGHAQALADSLTNRRQVFVVTHNYTGYPLIRLAQRMIEDDEIGEVQAVRTRYVQGWMRTRTPDSEAAQGHWKFDPQRTGPAGTWGDVGVHAFNLVRFVTRLEPARLQCHLRIFSQGGRLDDYGTAVWESTSGGLVTIVASQVSHGRGNELTIEIDGTRGSLAWNQEDPNKLWWRENGRPLRCLTRDPNASYAGNVLPANCRLPAGHPEGFLQAFANVYRSGFDAIRRVRNGEFIDPFDTEYPNVMDGLDGVRFIFRSLTSQEQGNCWVAW